MIPDREALGAQRTLEGIASRLGEWPRSRPVEWRRIPRPIRDELVAMRA
ncbi:MAG: hypothetical protein ACRDIX_07235 [Actinomycetota bacterium]